MNFYGKRHNVEFAVQHGCLSANVFWSSKNSTSFFPDFKIFFATREAPIASARPFNANNSVATFLSNSPELNFNVPTMHNLSKSLDKCAQQICLFYRQSSCMLRTCRLLLSYCDCRTYYFVKPSFLLDSVNFIKLAVLLANIQHQPSLPLL
ncbi:hypothetical protein TNIN_36941 [Trichonephila inaurata madagascariensis]|uniref:Uncharacterized protein n=1 Tax=Trichonephila inaurata madagascariensis TaxID=2747483 RepID=A0A8X6Y6N2_9ARAC|nr:hypothetical protein TNIN_36941 [Trichonephila inaurata madagascariensis]